MERLRKKNFSSNPFVTLLIGVNIVLLLIFFGSPFGENSRKNNNSFKKVDKINLTSLNPKDFFELKKIGSSRSSFKDLSNYFEDIAKEKGAGYAYNVLRLSELPPGTDLHLLGHVVGDILFEQRGLEGIQICTQDFRNACSHAIVVGLFYEDGEGALEKISNACREAPGGKGAYTMCFHGLGHGVLAYAGYDLEKTIGLCKQTGTTEYNDREFVECVGGSIMEMIAGVNDPEAWKAQYKNYFKENDPLYPCSADFMPDSVKGMCYNYLTPHLFIAAGGDLSDPTDSFEKAFTYCDAISSERIGERAACFGGFGKEFIVLAKERDIRDIDVMTEEQIKKVYNWCKLAPNREGAEYCLSFAMTSMYWGGENTYDSALGLCSVIDDPKYKDNCFGGLISNVSYYRPELQYIEKFCNDLPEPYGSQCRARIGL